MIFPAIRLIFTQNSWTPLPRPKRSVRRHQGAPSSGRYRGELHICCEILNKFIIFFFFKSSNIKFSMFRCTLPIFKQIISCLNSQCSDVEFWMFRYSACQCSDVQMFNSECSDVQPASRLAAGHLVSRLALARREQSPGYYRRHR